MRVRLCIRVSRHLPESHNQGPALFQLADVRAGGGGRGLRMKSGSKITVKQFLFNEPYSHLQIFFTAHSWSPYLPHAFVVCIIFAFLDCFCTLVLQIVVEGAA